MNKDQERETILAALGGKKGLFDSSIPSIIFLIILNVRDSLSDAIYGAIATGIFITIFRLIQRDTLQHAVGGFFGVLISAAIAWKTGSAEGFFITKIGINVVYMVIYLIGNISGYPVLGLVLGPLLGENLHWRKVPERKKAYIKAGWLWIGLFAFRLAVQVPLLDKDINALGTTNLLMGVPLFLLTGLLTWWVLKKVPTAIPPQEPLNEPLNEPLKDSD